MNSGSVGPPKGAPSRGRVEDAKAKHGLVLDRDLHEGGQREGRLRVLALLLRAVKVHKLEVVKSPGKFSVIHSDTPRL
jgi:hypothetical protein